MLIVMLYYILKIRKKQAFFDISVGFFMYLVIGGFLSIFWFVGISLVRSGYKQLKKNKETELYGNECYAIYIYHY